MSRLQSKYSPTCNPDPPFASEDLAREFRTIEVMISIFCRARHRKKELCGHCEDLLRFSEDRLRKCPHHHEKRPCKDCSTHCYKEPYRSAIREVMRFAGPRMLFSHPILAIRHLLAGLQKRRKNFI